MGTTSKEVKDSIAMHLTTIVSEAIDYFEASDERIKKAIEREWSAITR